MPDLFSKNTLHSSVGFFCHDCTDSSLRWCVEREGAVLKYDQIEFFFIFIFFAYGFVNMATHIACMLCVCVHSIAHY